MNYLATLFLLLTLSNTALATDAGLIDRIRLNSSDNSWGIEAEHIDGAISVFTIKNKDGNVIKVDISQYSLISYPKNESEENSKIIISGYALDVTKPENQEMVQVKLTIFPDGKYEFEYQ